MSGNRDVITELPGGWVKRCNQRLAGTNALKWDCYLTPPNGGKTIRSVPDLARFLVANPDVEIDPMFVNMDPPGTPQGTMTAGTERIMAAIESVKSGEIPSVAAARAPKKMFDADGAPLPDKRPKSKPVTYDAADYDFSWHNALGGKKKTTARKSTAGKSTARKSTGAKIKAAKYMFSPKQLNYLERQYKKVPKPIAAQFDYLSRQLKAPLDEVMKWFYTKRRNDLEEQERRRQERRSLDDLQSLLEPQVDITGLEDSGVSYGLSSNPDQGDESVMTEEAPSQPSESVSETLTSADPLIAIDGPVPSQEEEKVTIEHEDAEMDVIELQE